MCKLRLLNDSLRVCLCVHKPNTGFSSCCQWCGLWRKRCRSTVYRQHMSVMHDRQALWSNPTAQVDSILTYCTSPQQQSLNVCAYLWWAAQVVSSKTTMKESIYMAMNGNAANMCKHVTCTCWNSTTSSCDMQWGPRVYTFPRLPKPLPVAYTVKENTQKYLYGQNNIRDVCALRSTPICTHWGGPTLLQHSSLPKRLIVCAYLYELPRWLPVAYTVKKEMHRSTQMVMQQTHNLPGQPGITLGFMLDWRQKV